MRRRMGGRVGPLPERPPTRSSCRRSMARHGVRGLVSRPRWQYRDPARPISPTRAEGARFRRTQRTKTGSGAVCQRRALIADKARRADVELMIVDLRPARGIYPASGYTGPAGVNAARTIRVWAAVKRPKVSESPQTIVVESRDKPRPSGLGSDQDATTRPIHGGEGERAPKHPQF